MAVDRDLAAGVDEGRVLALVAQRAHQRRGAPVDEALGQPLVQRVGQPVLDLARPLLPMRGIVSQLARCDM